MVGACLLEKLLELIGRLPHLALEVTLGGGNDLLIGIVGLLDIVALIAAGSNCDLSGLPLWPLLLSLALLFVPLLATLGGTPQLPPGTAFPFPYMKRAPSTSSPEACRVVMSSSSFVVFS
jgi:hypothetical protein